MTTSQHSPEKAEYPPMNNGEFDTSPIFNYNNPQTTILNSYI